MAIIPFNKPYMTGKELEYISEAQRNGILAGDGPFSNRCHRWLEAHLGAGRAMLTPSGTAALEMAAILADIQPGDEVIMPSYTFVSTANAFVLRGGVPVFVDIRPDTLNIDERLIESAISTKTRAIVVVHYAGVACEMDAIMRISRKYGLLVIEDAAHGILAGYKGKPLGSIGHLGCLSFHETKNIISGEGGALLINDERLIERAEIVREKGTNRNRFFRGEIDKYTWCDIGSSFLPNEMTAAFLWAQLEAAEEITAKRLEIWNTYHAAAEDWERQGIWRRPIVPDEAMHNGHMYYLLTHSLSERTAVLAALGERGIKGAFHYVPLHKSLAGRRFGRVAGELTCTDSIADRLLRLPFWVGVNTQQVVSELRRIAESQTGIIEQA